MLTILFYCILVDFFCNKISSRSLYVNYVFFCVLRAVGVLGVVHAIVLKGSMYVSGGK